MVQTGNNVPRVLEAGLLKGTGIGSDKTWFHSKVEQMWKKEDNSGSERQQTLVLIVQTGTESGRRGVTEFFDERLRGFVCERAAVQSAEFVLIQHMVKKKKKNQQGGF